MPGKVNYRGKSRTHITVGKGGLFDYRNPQDAWDSISGSAIDNPYLISIDPGIYERVVPSQGTAAWAFNDKTDISIVGPRTAILRRLSPASGGTVSIGADGLLAERIRLDGFTIVNPLTGGGSGGSAGGAPPEGALYIGKENQLPTTLPYDDIEIVNMHILGSHDGLQIFGTEAPGGGPTVPPLVFVRNNLIQSRHDAYTIKGGVRLYSTSNQIYADSGSTFGGHLTDVNDWKTTGVHYNHALGVHADDAGRGEAFSVHTGEQITVVQNDNIGTNQFWCTGILNYLGASGMMSYPQEWTDCHIRVLNRFDAGVNDAVTLNGITFDRARFAENEFRFNGGSIFVHNANTESLSPGEISGVSIVEGISFTSPECKVRINGTSILVINDRAPQTVYSLSCHDQADYVIKHSGIISDQGINTSGGGVITHVAPRTDSA